MSIDTLINLRQANLKRHYEWMGDVEADPLFYGVELGGECGEALNVIKKLVREAQGARGSRATKEDLADELADVIICCELVAMCYDIHLEDAVPEKFNKTSEKYGLQTRMA